MMLEDFPTRDPEAPVLLIGAAGLDIVGRLEQAPQSGTSNPARIRATFGGTARNVAENLARLGQPACLLTVLGRDAVGEQLLKQAETAGVDVAHVLRVEASPTGSYMAVVDDQGDLLLALDDMRALVEHLTPAYLREHESLFRSASVLFLDANLPPRTLRTAFSLARKAKLPVVADPTAVNLAPRLKRYLPRLFMVVPNWREGCVLADHPPEAPCTVDGGRAVARALVQQGVHLAVVTLAESGVVYATAETDGYIPAIRTPVNDPTGVGDALSAAVIFAMLNQIPVDEAMRLGVSAAAITLRAQGAVAPDLSLERLYEELVI